MGRYAVKRLLSGIPVLLAVSVVVFLISTSAPGDPTELLLGSEDNRMYASADASYVQRMSEYSRAARRLGADFPPFYFSVVPATFSQPLYDIIHKEERKAAMAWCRTGVTASDVLNYRQTLLDVHAAIEQGTFTAGGNTKEAAVIIEFLLRTSDKNRSDALIEALGDTSVEGTAWTTAVSRIESAYKDMADSAIAPAAAALPRILWHGLANRYHNWLMGLLKGDPGISIVDGRPVGKKISEAVAWTLRINISAIVLAFVLAIPLGLATARRRDTAFDRWVNRLLFVFFAIPSFWLATLFIVFLTTPEYGQWLDLFPGSGTGRLDPARNTLERLWITTSHLVLPTVSLLLGMLAYLTRQMRQAVIREADKDYVRMARAKGLTEKEVYNRHIFRNALFPMITVLGAAVPASISGSVVIEVIFGIPGMGRLLYTSILAQDWGVTMAMVLLASGLTVVGFAMSDVLYRWADPRLRLNYAGL